jgi:hypothetical protein
MIEPNTKAITPVVTDAKGRANQKDMLRFITKRVEAYAPTAQKAAAPMVINPVLKSIAKDMARIMLMQSIMIRCI